VIGAVGTAFLITFSLATMVMVEVNQLANDLPRYETTLSEKIRNLRDAVGRAGLLTNASNLLKDLDRELNAKDQNEARVKSALPDNSKGKIPVPVEVHQPDPAASETLVAMLKPLVTPFTTIGIVIIFLIFFLFQREDLRNSFIELAGSDDLERTTAALDDAGRRLGKLFLSQLILNATFGAVIGLGLAVIGVPSAPLWGLLAMILRFIPYIGAILAAALPIALAAAVGSDWSMALWTIALFAVVEPLTGQVVEPLVCGRSAGLSPVAVVVAASFWTWVWGPLGLLLSTPLTLCLVVLARHVDRLQFIDVMLGDQPALTPQQAAYQRMLTGDPVEAIEQARSFLKEGSVEAYYEKIVVGALRLAAADAALGRLDERGSKTSIKPSRRSSRILAPIRSLQTKNRARRKSYPKPMWSILIRGNRGRSFSAYRASVALMIVWRWCWRTTSKGEVSSLEPRRPRPPSRVTPLRPYACAFSKMSRRREATLRSGNFPVRRHPPRSSSASWE
jgi:predicted PurR-regulated permease PerM